MDGQNDAAGHAIVIGGSLAGLTAAAALARHFGRVTVVERDALPEGPAFRPGVPQSRHIHNLLRRGQLALEELFPGFGAELVASGAPTIDWTAEGRFYYFGGWKPRFPSGLTTNLSSRENLEWILARRLRALPAVRFRSETEVVDLLLETANDQVRGVRTRPRGQQVGGEVHLAADLVVDASGRESRAPAWLAACGYTLPAPTVVNSFLGYASRWYEPPADVAVDWKALLIAATPPTSSRGAGIFPVEGNRWMVTLAGAARDYPPTDEDGFRAFARSLPSARLAEAIEAARPLSRIWGYRRTENRFAHYERAARWPERFVVLGDAACCFNPLYGQGMTVAALDALALDRCLREQRRRRPDGSLVGFARRFQSAQARVAAAPWLLATGEDFRYPETAGERPGRMIRVVHRYFDRVLISSTYSPRLHRRFLEVIHLLRPPLALFAPGVAGRVLLGMLWGEAAQTGDTATKAAERARLLAGPS